MGCFIWSCHISIVSIILILYLYLCFTIIIILPDLVMQRGSMVGSVFPFSIGILCHDPDEIPALSIVDVRVRHAL